MGVVRKNLATSKELLWEGLDRRKLRPTGEPEEHLCKELLFQEATFLQQPLRLERSLATHTHPVKPHTAKWHSNESTKNSKIWVETPPPCFLENSIYFLHFFRP